MTRPDPPPQFIPVLYPIGSRWFAHLRPVQPGDEWHQPDERWTARVNGDLDLIITQPRERQGENLGSVDVRTLAYFKTGYAAPLRLPETPTARLPTTAPCPVQGCCHLEITKTGSSAHPRDLPIDPAQADQPYTCPCPRRAILTTTLTARGWRLREHAPRQEYRATHNAIAHALLTGQAYQSRPQHVDRTADPTSARMEDAFRQTHHLLTQVRNNLLAGHLLAAQQLAEQSLAAEVAYRHHRRRYERTLRIDRQQGRWKNAETFYVDLLPTSPTHQLPDARRFTFQFIAVWTEAGWQMANGDEIERQSGMNVGPDAWTELIHLLGRLEDKPGAKAEHHLIWQEHHGILKLRPHIRAHYPRAVTALEALRLTLTPERSGEKQTPAAWTEAKPGWVNGVLEGVDSEPSIGQTALNLGQP